MEREMDNEDKTLVLCIAFILVITATGYYIKIRELNEFDVYTVYIEESSKYTIPKGEAEITVIRLKYYLTRDDLLVNGEHVYPLLSDQKQLALLAHPSHRLESDHVYRITIENTPYTRPRIYMLDIRDILQELREDSR